MSDKGICADLVKRVERIEKQLNIEAEPQDFCCVNEPPGSQLDVWLSSSDPHNADMRIRAWYSDDNYEWVIYTTYDAKTDDGDWGLRLPRTAMQGVRWTHIKEGE